MPAMTETQPRSDAMATICSGVAANFRAVAAGMMMMMENKN